MAQQPFPYASLPQLSGHQARAISLLARGVVGLSLERVLSALERPLGARPLIVPLAAESWPAGSAITRPDPNLVAVVVGDDVASGARRLVLELDPALAGYVVDRALGATAPEPRLSPGPSTEGECGTLTYVAASALVDSSFRVLGVITTVQALAHALGEEAHGVMLALPAQVELAGLMGWARLWVTPSRVQAHDGVSLDSSLPVELGLIGGQATLLASDVAALDIGDVVVPEHWRARQEDGVWKGELRAQSPHGGPIYVLHPEGEGWVLGTIESGSALGKSAQVIEGSGVMSTAERAASEANPHTGSVPVELSVELGRLALTVGELSGLVPGSVLVTGLPAGQPVLLRVGAKVVARGELLLVDGELGVRIQQLG